MPKKLQTWRGRNHAAVLAPAAFDAASAAAVPQIVAAVAPQRDRLDVCVVFPSMPAVMKLNKLGTFSMAQLGQSKSIIGDFIK